MCKFAENRLIMKKSLIILIAAVLAFAPGCDTFRKLAGRPTSEEIAEMKARIDSIEEARHQARIDSLRLVEKAMADSIAVLDSIKQINGTILNPSELGGLFTTKLDFRYYIVVGAFHSRTNAENLLTKVNGEGYTGTLISFRNGFNAVGICPTDMLQEAFNDLKKVKEEDFCPDDVWILVNE